MQEQMYLNGFIILSYEPDHDNKVITYCLYILFTFLCKYLIIMNEALLSLVTSSCIYLMINEMHHKSVLLYRVSTNERLDFKHLYFQSFYHITITDIWNSRKIYEIFFPPSINRWLHIHRMLWLKYKNGDNDREGVLCIRIIWSPRTPDLTSGDHPPCDFFYGVAYMKDIVYTLPRLKTLQ